MNEKTVVERAVIFVVIKYPAAPTSPKVTTGLFENVKGNDTFVDDDVPLPVAVPEQIRILVPF